jgi:hypothetical protein
MDNTSFKKIQNDIKKSTPIIIKNDDSINQIKQNFGNKYIDDISDSDDNTTYRKRNSNIINKLPDKNNTDNISLASKKENIVTTKKKLNKNINIIDDIKDPVDKPINKPNTNTKNTLNQLVNHINNVDSKDKNKPNVKEAESYSSSDSDSENTDAEVDDMEYEFQDEFEDKVKQYVKVDDEIRQLQKQIKELNVQKKATEETILKHLERLGENNINITGGKLRINKYESKEGFKEPMVKEVIADKIKDPKIIEHILEKIEEKRIANAKVQISLKRTYERAVNKKK